MVNGRILPRLAYLVRFFCLFVSFEARSKNLDEQVPTNPADFICPRHTLSTSLTLIKHFASSQVSDCCPLGYFSCSFPEPFSQTLYVCMVSRELFLLMHYQVTERFMMLCSAVSSMWEIAFKANYSCFFLFLALAAILFIGAEPF